MPPSPFQPRATVAVRDGAAPDHGSAATGTLRSLGRDEAAGARPAGAHA